MLRQHFTPLSSFSSSSLHITTTRFQAQYHQKSLFSQSFQPLYANKSKKFKKRVITVKKKKKPKKNHDSTAPEITLSSQRLKGSQLYRSILKAGLAFPVHKDNPVPVFPTILKEARYHFTLTERRVENGSYTETDLEDQITIGNKIAQGLWFGVLEQQDRKRKTRRNDISNFGAVVYSAAHGFGNQVYRDTLASTLVALVDYHFYSDQEQDQNDDLEEEIK
eukprot:gb/GECH01003076.1/.p1 GENE.gb/GECH01003076.1/~~gb/GECH01003076.1/.p1  ORF type:complete len:221 (+),score=59.99 gb/GECH01003076.1/:1-663(+)